MFVEIQVASFTEGPDYEGSGFYPVLLNVQPDRIRYIRTTSRPTKGDVKKVDYLYGYAVGFFDIEDELYIDKESYKKLCEMMPKS